MELVKAHNIDSDGLNPQVIFSVPGVNRFAGYYSSQYKGFCLCGAEKTNVFVAMSKRKDFLVSSCNVCSGEHKKFLSSVIKYKKEDKWGNYIKGCVSELFPLLKNFSGLTVTISGPLLDCDQDVLSSALTVGTIACLNVLFELKMSRQQIVDTAACVIRSFCSEIVSFANLYAVSNDDDKYIFYDTDNSSFSGIVDPFKGSDYEILVVDGKVSASVMREENDSMNDLVRESMSHFKTMYNRSSFKDLDDNDVIDLVESMDESEKRIILFLYEEYKVSCMLKKLFENRDFVGIGKAFTKIQKGIRDKIELTCPEIDWLAKRASELSSCLGYCMIFDGMGGRLALVIKRDDVGSYIQKIEMYEHIFGFCTNTYEFTPDNKLCLIDLNNPALQN